MTWTAFHRRSEVLRAVVAEADRRPDATLPTDVPGVTETFRDDLDLVGALQLRWHARLTGALDRHLAEQPADPAAAVRAAWTESAAALPGVRAILDAQALAGAREVREALALAAHKEHAVLAMSAGIAVVGDPQAAAIGAGLEQEAREQRAPLRTLAGDPRPGGFLQRLRAAVDKAA